MEEIIARTRKGGAEIVKLLEKGSAFYAPAASGVEMAESYLKEKKLLPCAAYLNGEYGYKNIYAGVPVVIGKKGVEKVIEIELDKKEKLNFDTSIKAVKELFQSAVKIDPTLTKIVLNSYSIKYYEFKNFVKKKLSFHFIDFCILSIYKSILCKLKEYFL